MKKILVTGANGQLGNCIRQQAGKYPEFEFIFTDVAELDICNGDAVSDFVSKNGVNIILNCAAYTAVDKAEDDIDLCKKINADAPANLATAAAQNNALLVHVSTDYVFDGNNNTPYTEDCATCPQSVYGSTKLEGENQIMKIAPTSIIVRTAWLYSEFGHNFVKTMMRLGNERHELSVVYDQVGSPTYAGDLAVAMLEICRKVSNSDSGEKYAGIYHFSNEGVCSWYDFTIEIHKMAGIKTCKVKPILSNLYPAKAKRPHYSVFDKGKIKSVFGIEIPHWTTSLQECVTKLAQ